MDTRVASIVIFFYLQLTKLRYNRSLHQIYMETRDMPMDKSIMDYTEAFLALP